MAEFKEGASSDASHPSEQGGPEYADDISASPAALQEEIAKQLENAEDPQDTEVGADTENGKEPVLSGEWEGARWEFYTSVEFPPDLPCTAAGCVVLHDSGVLLTRDDSKAIGDARRGNWEIPSGHADPIEPDDPQSPLETSEITTRRETLEEGGALLGDLHPFGYRTVYNFPSPNKTERQAKYPDESYMAYYWSFATSLQEPTEKGRHTSQVFSPEEINALHQAGKISETEFQIIRQGLAAAYKETSQESSSEAPELPLDYEVPLDYGRLLSGNESVVMFGEVHTAEGLLRDLAAHASDLKTSGIEAMLLEASQAQDFSAINAGDFSGLDDAVLGPDLRFVYMLDHSEAPSAIREEVEAHGDGIRAARKDLVRALVEAGIHVIPIDAADPDPNLEPGRPAAYARSNLREKTISDNIHRHAQAFGRVGVLIGKAHTKRGVGSYGGDPTLPYKEAAQRIDDLGLSYRTINCTDLAPTIPQSPSVKVTELSRFMVRPSTSWPGVTREDPVSWRSPADWRINVPPTEQETRIQRLKY